jgi:hypothetical protein
LAKFTDYTEKTEPVDTDLALIYDTPAKVNKKFTFGNLWKWIAKKIVSEGISQLDTTNKTIPGAINELNSNVKIDNIKYINCGGYGTLAAFSIGKLLYCKFNGNDKASEVKQRDIAQLPSEYTLNSSIGTYMNVLVRDHNTGTLQIDADGKITLYCPYQYLYGYVIIPIK